MKLALETNPRNCLDVQLHLPTGPLLMMTAPLGSDCWLFRVTLEKKLVLAAVPQFGGVNICLQAKDAGDCNMPYESDAAKILRAFRARVKKSVADGRCLEAIRMLQAAVKEWRGV